MGSHHRSCKVLNITGLWCVTVSVGASRHGWSWHDGEECLSGPTHSCLSIISSSDRWGRSVLEFSFNPWTISWAPQFAFILTALFADQTSLLKWLLSVLLTVAFSLSGNKELTNVSESDVLCSPHLSLIVPFCFIDRPYLPVRSASTHLFLEPCCNVYPLHWDELCM